MSIDIPQLALVVLIGPSGSGKSTFARKHFLPSEVLSSDECRRLVSDDENNQAATNEAFEVLHYIAAKRLAAGRLPWPFSIATSIANRPSRSSSPRTGNTAGRCRVPRGNCV